MGKFSKIIFVFFFIAIGFFAKATFAEAASRFWVGGTGTWDASDTTHWSDSSGGSGGFSVPGSADTVTLDGSSGGGTVTVTATVDVTSITMGAFTGTLDLNGQTINVGTFSLTGTGTRTLTMGSSAINVSGTGTAWNAGTLTNCTITANTATITMSGSNVTFLGATNWNGLSLVMNGSGSPALSAAFGTFANVTRTGTATKGDGLIIAAFTVTGTFTLNGNSASNRLFVISNSLLGIARTITNTGATMTWSNVDFRDVILSTAYNCSGITGGCGDAGGNSGITFTTATTNYWVGDTGNWSDVNEWANSSGGTGGTGRVPLPQDDVVFDNNSFSGNNSVSLDMPRLGKNINASAYNEGNTPILANNITNNTIYGSLTLNSNITSFSSSPNLTFEGRGDYTLTSAGNTFGPGTVSISMVGGSLTLQDAYVGSFTLTLSYGTFDANDFNVTTASVSISGSNSRTLTMGTGTWTVTSTGTVWNATTLTNMTFNEETSTILVSNTTATAKTFAGGSTTYYNLEITGSNVVLTGSNTFNNLALNNSAGVGGTRFTAGTTQTLTTFEADGSGSALVYASSTAASAATLTKAGGGTICEDYVHLTWLTGSPADTWYAGANSTDGGNTSGITFTACPAGGESSAPAVLFNGGVEITGGVLIE